MSFRRLTLVVLAIVLGATLGSGTARTAADTNPDVKPSGETVHCDSCPIYCTRTVCDLKDCHEESYICGWSSCNCH